MPKRDVDRLDLSLRLSDCEETSAAVEWAIPLHHRVDQLVTLAEDSGERTTRKELVAALVLAAPEDADELSRLLRAYRTSLARDALLAVPHGENVIELPRRGPGPRSRKSS